MTEFIAKINDAINFICILFYDYLLDLGCIIINIKVICGNFRVLGVTYEITEY